MLLPRYVKLKRRCSMPNSTLYWTSVPVVMHSLSWATLMLVTGTKRAGYEICVGPHGSGTRNDNSSFLLNFARSRRLRIAGSWYQRTALHRWTWYSNAGGVAKEIDYILATVQWLARLATNPWARVRSRTRTARTPPRFSSFTGR